MVIAKLALLVRHLGNAGSVAHGALQQGFVFLSRHPANMRPGLVIFHPGTMPQSNWPTTNFEVSPQDVRVEQPANAHRAHFTQGDFLRPVHPSRSFAGAPLALA